MANLQFLDLAGLSEFKDLITSYIDNADAASIKGVGLSEDGKSMLFYKVEPITGATAAYSVELPQTDTSTLMSLVSGAVEANLAIFDANGQVIDSGTALSALATAEQGKLAEAAVQSVTSGETNGTINVDGTEVSVAGLGSAAYTDASAYDAAGTAVEIAGVIPEGYSATTIAEYAKELADNVAANGYDDTALVTRVSNAEEAITTLNGDEETEGSVAYQVAAVKEELTDAITTAVASAGHLTRTIVSTLPEVADADELTIYLVAKENGSGDQVYDEYMLINGAFEKLGDTGVSLSGYATEEYADNVAASALSDAKDYTDEAISGITAIATADIEALFATE